MYRPYDWAPLAETDPLPGDPDTILYEAGRLRNMAAEITSQVETLRKIGPDGDSSGQSTEALRDSASEVAEKLEKVRDRYSKVSGHLYSWAGELEDLQIKTVRVLDKAVDAERQHGRDPHADLQRTGFTYMGIHSTGVETNPRDALEALLAEARRELQVLLREAAERDSYWGAQIGHAIDDKLTDGWRDHLHQLIEHHKGLVMGLTQALGYVTTAAALASIAFPPLMGVTIGLTAASLLVHTVEYEGGEASLVDIGLDIAALVSFGAAMKISKGLDETFNVTRQAASGAAGREAGEAMRLATYEARETAANTALVGKTAAARNAAKATVDAIDLRITQEEIDAAARVLQAPSADVGFLKSFVAGSREDAHFINDSRGLMAKYSEDAAVRRAGAHLDELVSAGRRNFLAAAAADGNDKFAMHAPFAKGFAARYNEGKERYVMGGGPLE